MFNCDLRGKEAQNQIDYEIQNCRAPRALPGAWPQNSLLMPPSGQKIAFKSLGDKVEACMIKCTLSPRDAGR